MGRPMTSDGRLEVQHRTPAPVAAVWAALADGWMYSSWVVGASRVRDVDLTWPEVDSRIHHSFGVWPALINDESVVIESEPGHRLVIQAKGWPMGEATVEITLAEAPAGSCLITIAEDATKGPGLIVPRALRQSAIAARNVEALRRLALIAEGRHREATA